jgi:hypothetical protein
LDGTQTEPNDFVGLRCRSTQPTNGIFYFGEGIDKEK